MNDSSHDKYDKRDEESGRFKSSYTDSEFIDAIESIGGMASSGEVADKVGCHRNLARERLKDLEEKGEVEGHKVGQGFVWSLA